jgi:hypothetical protein
MQWNCPHRGWRRAQLPVDAPVRAAALKSARALRLEPRGFPRFAAAKIAMDQATALIMPGRDGTQIVLRFFVDRSSLFVHSYK